jgi:hypothetical protein
MCSLHVTMRQCSLFTAHAASLARRRFRTFFALDKQVLSMKESLASPLQLSLFQPHMHSRVEH